MTNRDTVQQDFVLLSESTKTGRDLTIKQVCIFACIKRRNVRYIKAVTIIINGKTNGFVTAGPNSEEEKASLSFHGLKRVEDHLYMSLGEHFGSNLRII